MNAIALLSFQCRCVPRKAAKKQFAWRTSRGAPAMSLASFREKKAAQ
jgi:hypothetical protein